MTYKLRKTFVFLNPVMRTLVNDALTLTGPFPVRTRMRFRRSGSTCTSSNPETPEENRHDHYITTKYNFVIPLPL